MVIMLFTARCYASAVLPTGLCLSVFVSVCLCLSQVGILLKRLNVGSRRQHHMIAQFSDTKDLREIPPGSPPVRAPMQVGWVKIGDFRQKLAISRQEAPLSPSDRTMRLVSANYHATVQKLLIRRPAQTDGMKLEV